MHTPKNSQKNNRNSTTLCLKVQNAHFEFGDRLLLNCVFALIYQKALQWTSLTGWTNSRRSIFTRAHMLRKHNEAFCVEWVEVIFSVNQLRDLVLHSLMVHLQLNSAWAICWPYVSCLEVNQVLILESIWVTFGRVLP